VTLRDRLESIEDDGRLDLRARLAAVARLAEAYGKPPQAIVSDVDQPGSFILPSALAAIKRGVPSPVGAAPSGIALSDFSMRESLAVRPSCRLEAGA
jgi:hypothetical protein